MGFRKGELGPLSLKPAGLLKEPKELALGPEALELGLRREHDRQLKRRGSARAQHRRQQSFKRFQLPPRMGLGPAILCRSLIQRLSQSLGGCAAVPTPRPLIPLQGLNPPPFQKHALMLCFQTHSIGSINQQQGGTGCNSRPRFSKARAPHPGLGRAQLKQPSLRRKPAVKGFASG